MRQEKIEEFRERFANPFVAAEHGFIDDVIEPHETRPRVIRALRMLENKVDTMPRKKHGNLRYLRLRTPMAVMSSTRIISFTTNGSPYFTPMRLP